MGLHQAKLLPTSSKFSQPIRSNSVQSHQTNSNPLQQSLRSLGDTGKRVKPTPTVIEITRGYCERGVMKSDLQHIVATPPPIYRTLTYPAGQSCLKSSRLAYHFHRSISCARSARFLTKLLISPQMGIRRQLVHIAPIMQLGGASK